MHRLLIPLFLLIALFAPAISRSQDAEKEKPAPTEEEIQQAIKDLSSSEFLKREKAARLLWEGGRTARPFLEAAIEEGTEPEVRLRAEQILKKFRYGIYPDTPPELAEMLMLFRDGNQQQRRSIFSQLMQKQDFDTVLDLLETLPAEERNSFAQTMFRGRTDELVAPLIVRGDFKRAETILGIMAHRQEGARDLAAYHFFSGNIEKAIADEKTKKADPLHYSRLATLFRSKGDLAGALDAAKEIPDDGNRAATENAIRVAQGDTATYLKTLGLPSTRAGGINLESPELLSLFLTQARLKGDKEEFAKIAGKLRASLEANPDNIWYVTEAFLINDDPEAALEILKSKPQWKDRAAEILFEQRRPADVLATLEVDATTLEDLKPWIDKNLASLSKPSPAPGGEIPQEIRRVRLTIEAGLVHIARLHVRIGYLKEADALFTRIGDAIISSKTLPHELTFLVAEAADSRRAEAAIAIVRKALKEWPEAGETVVARLPLDDAGNWWGSVRNIEEFDTDLLKSFDRFLTIFPDTSTNPESRGDENGDLKKIDPAALAEAKSLIEKILENAVENNRPAFPGIGDRAEALGFPELAENVYTLLAKGARGEKGAPIPVASNDTFSALGEFYVRQERWPEAAEAFRSASAIKSNRDPVALYVLSWALKKSGDELGAADALKLARLLPLGDVSTRNLLAEEMWKRDDDKAALAEWKFVYETASPEEWEQGRAAQLLAENAAEEKRYADAANYLDRLMYSTLQMSSAFTEVRSYLRVRYRANYFRAMDAIAKKDGPAAAAATKAAFVHQPSDPTLSEEVFPALDELGQNAAVDEMFARAFELNDATCKLFPDDPQAHNSLAWLSARSNRRLDDALTHANRAVELDPDAAAYIDTLAETYFAKGDRAKAIELSEKAVARMPDDEELQGQLKRFKGE